MPIAVTGVIAMDHLMTFPGRFPERLVGGRLHAASLAFLAERLEIRRGGGGANIAFGLGRLGLDPVLVGAVGSDFADYQVWLKQHGVDTESVLVVPGEHTARHVCTTDIEGERVSTFRPGAMRAAAADSLPSLRSVAERAGGLGLVVVAPGERSAMLRHTEECRALGLPFVAHPSWQIGEMDRADLKYLISGASCLFTDEDESVRLRESTGLTRPQILGRVGAWVTTLGPAGARIERFGHEPSLVPSLGSVTVAEPSGAGDAFRAGFLAGFTKGAPHERAAQLGCVMASFALETTGTQEYAMDVRRLLNRVREAYGHTAAVSIRRLVTYAA
ncbi:carbohydrate kinase family protein [Streptomyces sp. NPDC055239]